jgi:hypothetical protein
LEECEVKEHASQWKILLRGVGEAYLRFSNISLPVAAVDEDVFSCYPARGQTLLNFLKRLL